MRLFFIAITAATVLVSLASQSVADEIPQEMLGDWLLRDDHDTLTVTRREVLSGGATCTIVSVKVVDQNPASPANERAAVVNMTCALEDARRPMKEREIWGVRRIGSDIVLITSHFDPPRIDVWHRR
jgi:hypothetical protein